jgi:hypothetical protein
MSLNFFFGEVVKVSGSEKDHDYAGDVQIRVEVDQDDKKRLKDEDLRWARNIFPPTYAQHRGVGISGGGLIPGSRIFGFYADNDRQTPYILGSVATAGEYGSLKVGDVSTRARGLPGAGDQKEKSLFGLTGDFFPVDHKTANELVNPPEPKAAKQPPKVKKKEQAPQGDAESAPQAKLPSLTGIKPPSSVSDMVNVVKGFNPQNLGGLPSTLGAFQNLRGKLEGTTKDLIGNLPFSQMNILSSVVNMNPSNLIGSIGSMAGGLSGLTSALGGPQQALSAIQSNFFASIPMNPLQKMAVNIATGALKSNIDLSTLSSVMQGVQQGIGTSSELNQIASVLTQSAAFNPAVSQEVQKLVTVSQVVNQIEGLMQNIDLANPSSINSFVQENLGELQGLATQVGNVLGVGNLASLASNPLNLINQIQNLAGGGIANALGGSMGGGVGAGSKERMPTDPAKPEYPHNQVQKTTGGHTIKVDNTPDKEQLFVSHKANSFFRVDPDGSIVVHGAKNLHEQVKGTRTLTVEGFSDITVKGSKIVIRGGSLIEIMGNCDLNVIGDMNVVVSENFKLTAKNISMVADDQLYTNTKTTKNDVFEKHIINSQEIEANASFSITEKSVGVINLEAGTNVDVSSKGTTSIDSGSRIDLTAKNDIITVGKTTKIQGGGAGAPPTTFN